MKSYWMSKIDKKLNFDGHIRSLCKKAKSKLNTPARKTPYMEFEKKKIILNSFFN